MDRSISIRESVFDVQETLLIAIGLVIMVIFLFLRSVSATIIPALAVPISLIGTCAAMYAFGFSINNMTLLALTLSVGFVVDDAIVMLENIVRHIEDGMRPFEAALKGAREIGFTIISITFSLIAVFIPVLLMGGMVGRVFREFAVTIAVAIIVSGFVSLTLTPMLCARVLRAPPRRREAEHRAAAVRGDVQRLAAGLRMDARQGAGVQAVTLMVTLATMAGTVYLYIIIPKGFFPHRGHRLHLGHARRRPTSRSARWSSGRARSPRSSAGQGGRIRQFDRGRRADRTRPTNTGRMFVALKPKAERGEAPAWWSQRLRRDDRPDLRHARSTSARSRTSTSVDASPRASTSTRCSRATPRRFIAVAPEMLETRSRRSRGCATSTATSTSRIRR